MRDDDKAKLVKFRLKHQEKFDFRENIPNFIKPKSKLRTILNCICGIESINGNQQAVQESSEEVPKDTSIYQSKFASNMCDLTAVGVMALCGFCYAFFNKF